MNVQKHDLRNNHILSKILIYLKLTYSEPSQLPGSHHQATRVAAHGIFNNFISLAIFKFPASYDTL